MSYTYEPTDRLTPTDGSLRGEIRILFPSQSLSDRFNLYSHYIQSFSPCQCFCLKLNFSSDWERNLVLALCGRKVGEAVARPGAGNPSQAGLRFWRKEECAPPAKALCRGTAASPRPPVFAPLALGAWQYRGKNLLCTGENVKMNLNRI